jgi:hypothetical protein
LHEWAGRRGRVYLSETVRVWFIRASAQGGWLTDGTYGMTRTTRLADYLDHRFQVHAQGSWYWIVDRPYQPGEVGKLF